MELGLRERYRLLERELAEVSRAAGRDPRAVAVVAVTKAQPAAAVREAVAAGIAEIGENYLQEARAKFEELASQPGVAMPRKHFIGHLQTNKAAAIAAIFDLVQSVDRIEAGRALAKAARSLGKVLPVLVHVNVSASPRYGCDPERAEALAEALRAEQGLAVDGVMAIGPLAADLESIARSFEAAAKTFRRVGGKTLSMGMSGDWREAVRHGSTMIRIGTALFGPRPVSLTYGTAPGNEETRLVS